MEKPAILNESGRALLREEFYKAMAALRVYHRAVEEQWLAGWRDILEGRPIDTTRLLSAIPRELAARSVWEGAHKDWERRLMEVCIKCAEQTGEEESPPAGPDSNTSWRDTGD